MSRFHRGGPAFQKPENALKRAEELIAVGQPGSALQTLHDVITSKRHRTWQKVLEQIMQRYIELCIDLKKGRYAKDGLIHYRNVCQQVNVSSLEEVIKFFLKTATDRAEAAQSKADSTAVTLDVDDLEVDATPEDLMLSYVSGEKGKDRTDRELVTPWFKFLWETYRTVLDVLRNNSRLEALYAMTAAKAFQFCAAYKRTTEFRRLCDILRNHLNSLNKYRDQRDRPDLTNPETIQLYLDSRFEQLRVACELELWQEAFRSVEDIQGLFLLGKRPARPQTMAVYYARLARIFSVSEAHLYNGYAWYKLFNLAKTYNKHLTPADVQQLSCNVLLAALAILPYEAPELARTEAEIEQERERSLRMASILGFNLDPRKDPRSVLSRGNLLAELTAKGLLNLVPEPVKQLYAALETDFAPLQLCHRLAPLLEQLDGADQPLSGASPVVEAPLGQYKRGLQQVAVLRLLQQLGQVYSVMRIDRLKALVPFMGFGEVEAIIVEAVKSEFLQARIDHRAGTVHFGGLEVESDALRGHLAALSRGLRSALRMVRPEQPPEHEARRLELVREAIASAEQDTERMAARKILIEKKKEEAERILLAAERAEEEKRIMQERQSVAAEEERRRLDRLKREEDRIAREIAEKEEEEARAVLEQAAKGGKIKLQTGDKLDKAAILSQVHTEQRRAKEEAEKKLTKYMRQLDHFERARREEEAPIIEQQHKEQLAADEVEHGKEQERQAELHRQAWEADVQEKRRLARMAAAKDRLAADIMSRRTAEFEALKREREQEVARRKAERARVRDLKRREAFVKQCRLDIEERRLREEAEAEQRAEEQRVREEAERKRKLEEKEAAEKARRREAEMEERARREREAAAPARAEPPADRSGRFQPSAMRRPGGAPAAAAPSADGDRWGRPAPAAAPPPATGPAPAAGGAPPPREDRWRPSRLSEPPSRPSEGAFGARRSEAPPDSGSRWGPARREERGDPPPREAPQPRPGGRWQPPSARGGQGDAPPPARNDRGGRW